MYRFIPRVVVLAPQDSNLVVYAHHQDFITNLRFSHVAAGANERRLYSQAKFQCFNMLFLWLRPLRNSSGMVLGSRARLDRLVARFLR